MTHSWFMALGLHAILFMVVGLAFDEEIPSEVPEEPHYECSWAVEWPRIPWLERSFEPVQQPLRGCHHDALLAREMGRDASLGNIRCEFCGRIWGRITGTPLN